MKYPKVKVKLLGQNGNSLNLISLCSEAARKGKVPSDEIRNFREEAISGDYDHLLRTCMKWFNVS